MSKLPLREKKVEVLSPWVQAGLTLLQGVLPAMSAIIGGWWVLSTHYAEQAASERTQAEQQKTSARSRYLDARKPFFDKQLAVYSETARVGGLLATLQPGTSEWSQNKARFYALYWSELTMVEDRDVADSMVKLERTLRNFASRTTSQHDVQIRTYCLSRALKQSIEGTWSLEVQASALPLPPDVPTRDQCAQSVEIKEAKLGASTTITPATPDNFAPASGTEKSGQKVP